MNIMKIVPKYGVLLGFVALLCTAVSGGIYFLTKDRIELAIATHQRELLLQVIPQHYFDNDLLADCVKSSEPQIGRIYLAKKSQELTAFAFETTAPDGYSGNIRLLVGLTPQGKVLGVRTIEHKETPGLGDKLELRFSDWILAFDNQTIEPNNLTEWAVKKDGGKFDQFAGATITPRAVVNQVKRSALLMLQQSSLPTQPCEAK